MSKKTPATAQEVAAPYQPTEAERVAIAEMLERIKAQDASPSLTITDKNGVKQIGTDHPDETTGQLLLMKALGVSDNRFYSGLIGQLANAGLLGKADDARGVNFMLAAVKGAAPQDEIEAMLAAQMAAVHMATMTFARRLAHVDTIPQQDSATRGFTKLARTFAAQMEALKRYRTGGEQKVTVHHVTVRDGGQAIVGTVSTGGRGRSEKPKVTP